MVTSKQLYLRDVCYDVSSIDDDKLLVMNVILYFAEFYVHDLP